MFRFMKWFWRRAQADAAKDILLYINHVSAPAEVFVNKDFSNLQAGKTQVVPVEQLRHVLGSQYLEPQRKKTTANEARGIEHAVRQPN